MKIPSPLVPLFFSALATGALADSGAWKSQRLLSDFHAEGSAVGDLNGNGHVDIAYGPFWFEGPEFDERHRFTEGEPFVPDGGYSDNFFSFIHDIDGDGWNDIVVFGFPGKEVRLYLNPGTGRAADEPWPMRQIVDELGHESPHFVDLVPGGLPEIVGSRGTTYGYYAAGENPSEPWIWHAISDEGEAGGRFEHGLGVGDLNGNGRLDLVTSQDWFEHPGPDHEGSWTKHRWAPIAYGRGGAQILVADVNGSGRADLVTSLNGHGYGLAWFEQVSPGRFARHDIMGETSTDNPFGVCFSQLHALALADMDGDGRLDFVTGKRYFAHNGRDPGGLAAPVLHWFRNTVAAEAPGGVEWAPHFVDDDSGVGVAVTVADLNDDGHLDIVSGNKKGLAIHLRNTEVPFVAEERWEVPGGRPQDDYDENLGPGEALARMEVPEGFSVDLLAAEPDVTQPIAMCFDSRGRLWVVEGHSYPQRRPEGEGLDRILVFADSNGDGEFDSSSVFADGINLASGIAVGFGGVYVGAPPYLLFYPDADGDARSDGEPEILLDGWGHQDTHETLNSFTWGPDGWLYGCHGVFTHSNVGPPGTPEEEREKINAGVWRYHPVTREFEVFAHGTSNPWGLDFDEYGNCFISACVIPHFYHISQGGRYQRQAGQHFDPWTFDDIKTIADHAHFVGNIRDHAFWGANKEDRPPSPADTSALGGGHAHCGLALYLADVFPPEYRGDAFLHNLHGHRIVRERIERDGSGHVARHRPDFVLTNNHDFVGVSVLLGPDGALYLSDWVDGQTCHHRDVEIWDRENGRLFRVRHGEARSPALDLPDRSDAELVAALGHGNAFHARHAQRLLQERAASGRLDRDAVGEALAKFENERAEEVPLLLRAFWTRHVIGQLSSEQTLLALSDPSEHVRGWAVQLALPDGDALRRFAEMAQTEDSLVVRRHLASKLQRLPLEQRWPIAEGLVTHPRSGFDRNIPLLAWYGIEPLVEADPGRALGLVNRTPWATLKDFITRRAAVDAAGRDAIMTSLSGAGNADEFRQRGGQLLTALESQPAVERPAGWESAKARGEALAADSPEAAEILARLGARFGDADYFPKWRETARDREARMPSRIAALELLTSGNDPEIGVLARELLDISALRPAALAGLRQAPGKETAEALVSRLADFPPAERNEAINLLATRPAMALVLLEAVDGKKLPASLVSPALLDQFERFEDEAITEIVERHWTRGGSEVDLAQIFRSIEQWKRRLNERVMANADASRGREVYNTSCGACHQLFGEGIHLGPELTGSNRADLGYILENVLAPNATVGRDYQLNVFTLKDDSIVSGMVREETPDFVKVAMPGGSVVDVKTADIAKREELPQSLMPAGLFDALTLPQVADLVKYLASPAQVPLPGEASGSATAAATPDASTVPPSAEGVLRIEAATLLATAQAKGGTVKPQGMRGFGPGWSADSQLWWTGGEPGDILTLRLEGLEPGTKNLVLFPTTARDYATIRVAVNGQLQEADLYTERVLPGEPLRFKNVNVSPSEPLQIDIHITGKNEAADPRHMVGIDRVEVESAK